MSPHSETQNDQDRKAKLQQRYLPIIRVFVSSTFSDLKQERDALAQHVWPKLEAYCQQEGFQFQAIDLRWGVSTEAGMHHRTMKICFEELRRSQKISPEPNFLVLLGDRYGWRPLPEEISKPEYNQLASAAAKVESEVVGQSPLQVLDRWYWRDENSLTPIYVLQPRLKPKTEDSDQTDYTDPKVWKPIEETLWRIINEAFPPEDMRGRFDLTTESSETVPSIVRFQASATEQEIWAGALQIRNAKEHVVACVRNITNRDNFKPTELKDFFNVKGEGEQCEFDEDAHVAQEELKKELIDNQLDKRRIVPMPWNTLTHDGDKVVVNVSEAELEQFCEQVREQLQEIIKHQMQEYWQPKAPAPEDKNPSSDPRTTRELEIERDEHLRFSRERGSSDKFVGRDGPLERIRDYLSSDSRYPLVIHGESGCGKTALLARAFEDVPNQNQAIIRFLGTTTRSSDLRSLLKNLCQELRSRNAIPEVLPEDIQELTQEFRRHLNAAVAERPIILFLDALDQLSDADNGRQLFWLPYGELPANVKIVVSCLSDRDEQDPAGKPYRSLQARALAADNWLNLNALSLDEAKKLLFNEWLPPAGRKVTATQKQLIETQLASGVECRQPIYLKLLFEEVRLWSSYDTESVLGESVSALLKKLFDRLSDEANHGPLLVNRVLGYLSASRHGLAENEILEILFDDPEYQEKLKEDNKRTGHELAPNAKRIPIALWSRLRFDLAPYLSERAAPGANVLTFYHRQVQQLIEERYLIETEGRIAHLKLAVYFDRACRVESNQYLPQKRPIGELAFHYRVAGDNARLKAIYADMSYFCNYVQCHSAFELKDEMQEVTSTCIEKELLDFIEDSAVVLTLYPLQAPQLIYKELTSPAFRAQAEQLAVRPWIRADRIDQAVDKLGKRHLAVSVRSSVTMDIQASCVAEKSGIAFLHKAANRIDVIQTFDLRTVGEIFIVDQPNFVVNRMLCDRFGKLLVLVYETGHVEVMQIDYNEVGFVLRASSVHSGMCRTGRFGALAISISQDEVVYQSNTGHIVTVNLDVDGRISFLESPCLDKVLIEIFASNVRCLLWRVGREFLLTFEETSTPVLRLAYRALAACQFGRMLAVSTEDAKLSIYQWPDLTLHATISTRLPILSMSPINSPCVLMTDRHGNILLLDQELQLVDHGRCTREPIDDYPSAIYSTNGDGFYVSNNRCAAITISKSHASDDIVAVDGDDKSVSLLTYSRSSGFAISICGKEPRSLQQSIVGQQYEFEYNNFRISWNKKGAVAYTKYNNEVAIEMGNYSSSMTTADRIVSIRYSEAASIFLVLSCTGFLQFFRVDGKTSSSIQLATSSTGHYLMEVCGQHICTLARNVGVQTKAANRYNESILSIHRLRRDSESLEAELVYLQHINNRQSPIFGLSYNTTSNSLYLNRPGMLERWQLDNPTQPEITQVAMSGDYSATRQITAHHQGAFYVNLDNQLKYQPINSGKPVTELTSFRTITFLVPRMAECGYFVENNTIVYRFTLEQ